MTNDLSIVRDVLGEELSPDVIDSAAKNAKSIIRPLVDAWYPNAHSDDFPARRPGELSYFIPGSMWSSTDRGRELSHAYDDGLIALLYVHRIIINSPLLMLSSAANRGKSLECCSDLLFTSLHLLLSLKELIDAGIVVIVGSDANYWSGAARDVLGESEYDSLDYMTRHIIEFSQTSGCAIDLFVNSDTEYTRLEKVLCGDHRSMLSGRSDAVHLSALFEELVPDVTELDVREIVRIREDDSFEQWRTDLRTAIRRMIAINSVGDVAGEGIEEVRELMHEKAVRIHEAVAASSSMTNLRKHVASFAVGSVGAASVMPIVGQVNVASEVAMLGGSLGIGTFLIGLAAAARALRAPRPGKQALAYHYAFLGKYIRR